jgi:hypothetical protein
MSNIPKIRRMIGLALWFTMQLGGSGWAQPGWQLSLFVQPFPSPYLSDWENNPTLGSLTITNTTGNAADVVLRLTILRRSGSQVARGNSTPILVPPDVPTSINSDRFIDWGTVSYDNSIETKAVRTGRLPEGEYTLCISAEDMSGAGLASPVCADFSIVYPDPPLLILPVSGDSIATPFPIFSWTPVQVPVGFQVHYILLIVEVLPGQTPYQALVANVPQYESADILTTILQYPIDALPFKEGSTYAWQVRVLDQNGEPPSANGGRSEIWTFVFREEVPIQPAGELTLTLGAEGSITGPLSDFESSSFESASTRLRSFSGGGTLQLPFTLPSSFEPITIGGATIYIDNARKSIAIRGRKTVRGREYDVLFTAVWGTRQDPRHKALSIKGPMVNGLFHGAGFLDSLATRQAFFIVSGADFDLKSEELPDSVTDYYEEPVGVKPGLNFYAKIDLSRSPGLDSVAGWLGIPQPSVKLKGYLSSQINFLFSKGDTSQSAGVQFSHDFALSASIPAWRPAPFRDWMKEAVAELQIGVKSETPSPTTLEPKLRVAFALQATVAFDFLKGREIKFKGAVQREGLKEGEWSIELSADDIIKLPAFENVFSLHDPKLVYEFVNRTLKASFEFDIGRITKVGEMEIARRFGKARADSIGGMPDTTGAIPDTAATHRAIPQTPITAVMMNKDRPEPEVAVPKPGEVQSKWKATAKFNASALRTLSVSELLKALWNFGDNLDWLPPLTLQSLGMNFSPGSAGSMVLRAAAEAGGSSTDLIASGVVTGTGSRGLILGVRPENWSLKSVLPDLSIPGMEGLTLSNVSLVLSPVDLAVTSADMTEEEIAFYSKSYGSDQFYLNLRRGLNVIATIPADQLPQNSPMNPLMDRLGIEKGPLLLQGAVGNRAKELYLLAAFPPMHPPGAPGWFHSGQLALELTGQPSVGLVGFLTVNIEDDQVTFFVKTKAGKEGLILAGGLYAQEGWDEPFGIQWLTLNQVTLLLGLTPGGSVQMGFRGDMIIGEKDIDVAVLVALNVATGVPTNFMFDGESEAGLGMPDLVDLQARIAEASGGGGNRIPLNAVPPMGLKNMKLKFAPKDSPELGISKGLTIGGLLYLESSSGSETKEIAQALLDIGVEGIIAQGSIGKFTLGPVSLDEATLDLTLTREDQHFNLRGKSDLGFLKSDITVELSKRSALFSTSGKIFDLFEADLHASGVLKFPNPAFDVNGKLKNDFNTAVSGAFAQELEKVVAANLKKAQSEFAAADRQWNTAVNARQEAQKRWQNTPLLPRDKKVAARKAWEQRTAAALAKRGIRLQKNTARTKWLAVNTALEQFVQASGRERLIVVENAEFAADLKSMKTGKVKTMDLALKVKGEERNLALSGWDFRDIRKGVRSGVQQLARSLFEKAE